MKRAATGPGAAHQVDLQYAVGRAEVPAASSLRRWAVTVLEREEAAPGNLAIRVVDREEARTLNHQWRGRDRATNVLSFPGDNLPGLPWRPWGDIVLCKPVILAEAEEQDKPPRAHWAHMVVHGTLHLLGHDHQQDEEARIMEDRERQILAGFGFADPYAPRPSSADAKGKP